MAIDAQMPRNLLLLDLDETLIHARETPLERPADFLAFQYHIYRRPHLEHFLETCADHYELAVWSSASDQYVEAVVREIVPPSIRLKFVWGRSRASLKRVITDQDGFFDPQDHLSYRKPLAKLKRLGWPLERILIVDDTPSKSRQNYGNAIYPKAWEGEPDDEELKLLSHYLPKLADCANVRSVEKRNWRSEARRMLQF